MKIKLSFHYYQKGLGMGEQSFRFGFSHYLDVFKIRDNGKIINEIVYLYVDLKQNGLKEVLGM